MKLSEKQRIFTRNIAKLIVYAYQNGFELTFGDAFRTVEQQEIYIEQGKSKTMNSMHLQRLAVDFNFFINNKLTYKKEDVEMLGKYWESLHEDNSWGGYWRFKDTPHFQMA